MTAASDRYQLTEDERTLLGIIANQNDRHVTRWEMPDNIARLRHLAAIGLAEEHDTQLIDGCLPFVGFAITATGIAYLRLLGETVP